MKPRRYLLISLGCPKNLVDSETFCYIANQHGFEQADDIKALDFVLVNTCSFIQEAVDELIRLLKLLCRDKAHGDIKRIYVTGCIMKRYLEEMKDRFPQIDAWIPIRGYKTFERLISEQTLGSYRRWPLAYSPATYLKISEGCSNNCSYCTIPSIRGPLSSADVSDLVDEAVRLAALGFSELIVIAQDTAAYGLDRKQSDGLVELLKCLHDIESYRWIRLMYLHPGHINRKLVAAISSLPRIVRAFEIPIQHCNDDILKAMNRPYRKKDILNVLEMFRSAMPEAEFRTTMMTGFPGESRAKFNELLRFISDNRFLRLGAFAFSAEPGTPAFSLPGRPSAKTAGKRKLELLAVHRQLSEQYLSELIGNEVEVLVEEVFPQEHACTGRAWFDAPEIDGVVNIQGQNCRAGDHVSVLIDDVIDIDLFGEAQKVVHRK